jgi:type IV pilus assembly protein PilB
MATPTPKLTLGGLARKLVEDSLLSQSVAEDAFQRALQTRTPFVTYIVREKLVNSRDVAHVAATEFGVPLVDIDAIDLDKEITTLVGDKLIQKHNALPVFKRGKKLFVAMSDPTNLQAVDEIKFHANMNIETILVEEDRLAKAIEKAMEAADTSMTELGGDGLEGMEELEEAEIDDKDETQSDAEDAPVVRFVNKMLSDAIKIDASDLHFEPYEKFFRVRFRVDGMLRTVAKPPLGLKLKIAARIKVMSRMDVSERRVPQDGRIKLKISKSKAIDFRVSTCPTLYGEKVVMRILKSDVASLNIDMLGYEDFQKKLYLEALEKPYGMVLVTGPTGSGKTVSLYTGINIINREHVNISTAEDPVEINLPGVNQVQIDEKTGMTFAKALKAFLRQDPDIILVGEIRDLETGGIAIKAAQTGHMVMSTLHTNDAPQTLTRMIDMGIQPFAIATAVNLIMAQRLARRLCKHCKRVVIVTEDVAKANPPYVLHKDAVLAEGFNNDDLKEFMSSDKESKKIYAPNREGCEQCTSGYKGRVGIYQVMPISEEMKRLIMNKANAIDLADQAKKEGIPDLRQSALKKVKDGLTSLEEANRVTVE